MHNSELLNKSHPPASGSYDNKEEFGGSVLFIKDGISAVKGITLVPTAGAANVCEVAISLFDGGGTLIPAVQNLKVWLSDTATGAGQTATAASGTVTNKTASGTVLDTLTAKKSLIVQTLATGVFTLEITDSAKTTFYVCVENPFTGQTVVSRILATGDYGA